MEELIQELGDICHQHYLGSVGNKEAPDGYEYNYDTEVIIMLETPEARQAIAALLKVEVAKAKIEGKIRELRLNVVRGYIPDNVASVRRVILEAELAEVESNKEGAKACDYCNTPNCELPCHNTSNKEGVEVNE